MAGTGTGLAGLRVMVVEDEMLVSLMIEDVLTDANCVILGPYSRVPAALEAARSLTIDAAVLDVNLAGIRVYPVAEVLQARGIPFLLLSGYGRDGIPSEHPEWRVCTKPFSGDELMAKLRAQIEESQGAVPPWSAR